MTATARAADGRPRAAARAVRFYGAILLLFAATLFAFRQSPRPDPRKPVTFASLEWWRDPAERNAWRRLPFVGGDLHGVFALADGRHVWVVGEYGTIVVSRDGGRTWAKGEVDWQARRGVDESPGAAAPAQSSQILAPTPGSPAVGRGAESSVRAAGWSLVTDAHAESAGGRAEAPPSKSVEQKQAPPPVTQGPVRSRVVNPRTTSPAPGPRKDTSPGGAKTEQPGAEPVVRRDLSRPADLHDVYFVDDRRGWAAGDEGTILATTDGGDHWVRQPAPSTGSLKSIRFGGDGRTGWATSGGALLRTVDGGGTWIRRNDPPSPLSVAQDVQFLADGRRGWSLFASPASIRATTDGGVTWGEPVALPAAGLLSIRFLEDGRRGWVVGYGGAILHTADAGLTWSRQASGANAGLRSIRFLPDGLRGWVVGDDGTLLSTADGGTTWRQRESRSPASLQSIHLGDDGRRGWIVGERGTILATVDGGDTWTPMTGGLAAIAFSVARAGKAALAVTASGAILRTTDAGRTWRCAPDPPNAGLTGIDMLRDGRRGWAVGVRGAILHTEDGGNTWVPQTSPTREDLRAVHILEDGRRGWAVGLNGTILGTGDGGVTWRTARSPGLMNLASVHFMEDGQRGWIAGSGGTLLATTDGGGTWLRQDIGTEAHLDDIRFTDDGRRGWIVGSRGTILGTEDGGAHWLPQPGGTEEWLLGSFFLPDGMRGWVVGLRGTILVTENGGQSWRRAESHSEAPLFDVDFDADGRRGLIVGWGPTILFTRDGGRTWSEPEYRRSPAPWYWLLGLATLVGIALPALRRPAPIDAETPSVADMLASDRPLQAGDPDPLDFRALAAGVARFLANEKTRPPLTLAITGDWGTGKSSLMNLIRSHMNRYRFPTVWFNVWHHQSEEHLLASLMESIQRQAIPPWWSPAGWTFRMRLLFIRGMKNWLPVTALLFVFAVLARSFLGEGGEDRFQSAMTGLAHLVTLSVPARWEEGKSLVALLLAVVGPLYAIARGSSAFGSSPSRVASTLLGKFRTSGMGTQPGFREQFAAVFEQVTTALRPRRLLIFMDDLDRCQPANAVQALETVNFLVSSGECYVVLGMAPDWVIRSVGLGFKDVAEAIDDGEENEGPLAAPAKGPVDPRARLHRFARKYLEKLINIEVPLPKPKDDSARRLLVPVDARETPRAAGWKGVLAGTGRFVEAVWAPAALLLVVGAGLLIQPDWTGRLFSILSGTPEAAATVAPSMYDVRLIPGARETTTGVPGEFTIRLLPGGATGEHGGAGGAHGGAEGATAAVSPAGGGTTRAPAKGSDEPDPAAYARGVLREGPPVHARSWPIHIALGALLVAGLILLAVQPVRLEQDSPKFSKALDLWFPLVFAANPTPRAIKRFLNRVRYFAMCQRRPEDAASGHGIPNGLPAVPESNQSGRANDKPGPLGIPEDVLVALSAVHHFQPQWVEEQALWEDFGSFVQRHAAELPPALLKRMPEIETLGRLVEYRDAFETMSRGVRVVH